MDQMAAFFITLKGEIGYIHFISKMNIDEYISRVTYKDLVVQLCYIKVV